MTTAGRLVATAATFASFMLLVRVLDDAEYAQLGLITGLQSFVHTILVGPAVNYAQREVWEWLAKGLLVRRSGYLVYGTSLVFLAAIILVVLGASHLGWVAVDSIWAVLAGMVLAALVNVITTVFLVAAVLRDRVGYATYLTLDGVSRLAMAAALALAGERSAWVYFLAMQAAGFCGVVLAYAIRRAHLAKAGLVLRRLSAESARWDPRQIASILSGSSALRLTTILAWMLTTGNRYVLEPLIARETLGAFLAAWGLGLAVLGAVGGVYGAVMVPVLYENTSGENDTPERRSGENGLYLATLGAVLLPVAAVTWVAAEHLAALLLGEAGGIAVPVVRAGVTFATLDNLVGVLMNVALVQRRPKYTTVAMGVAFVVGIGGLHLLTKAFGPVFGAWGLALGSLAGLVVLASLLRKAIASRPILGFAGSVAIGSAACTVVGLVAFRVYDALALSRYWLLPFWLIVGAQWGAYVWFTVRPRSQRLRQQIDMSSAMLGSEQSSGPVSPPVAR